MPMLATAYALHFAKNQLVDMYCEMKRSRDEELIADVHSFSAGELLGLSRGSPEWLAPALLMLRRVAAC